MYCDECGNKNNEGAKFCSGCGHELIISKQKNEEDNNVSIDLEKVKRKISVTGRSVYFVGMLSLLSGLFILFLKFSGENLVDYGLIDSYLNVFSTLLLGGILSFYGNNVWNNYNSDTKKSLQVILWTTVFSLIGMIAALLLHGLNFITWIFLYNSIFYSWFFASLIIAYVSFSIKSLNKVDNFEGLSLEDERSKTGIFLLTAFLIITAISLFAYDYTDSVPINEVSPSDYEVPVKTFYTITNSNVRSCASITCDKIGYYPPQSELYFEYESLEEMPEWLEVPIDTGEIGYLSKTTLSEQVVTSDFPYEVPSLQYDWYDRHNVPMAYRCYTTMTNPCSETEWNTALNYGD